MERWRTLRAGFPYYSGVTNGLPITLRVSNAARFRATLRRGIEAGAIGAAAGACVGIAAVMLDRLGVLSTVFDAMAGDASGVFVRTALGVGIPAGIGIVAGVAHAIWTRGTLLEAARRVDEACGLHDRLGSAVAMSGARGSDPAMIALVMAESERVASGVSVSRAIAVVPRSRAWAGPVAIASTALLAWVLPATISFDAISGKKPVADASKSAVAEATVGEVKQVAETVASNAAEMNDPRLARIGREIEEMQRELDGAGITRNRDVAPAETLARAADKAQQAAAAMDEASQRRQSDSDEVRMALAESAEGIASSPAGEQSAASEMARALADGDVAQAAAATKELATQAETMSDADRARAARDLADLARLTEREAAKLNEKRAAERALSESEATQPARDVARDVERNADGSASRQQPEQEDASAQNAEQNETPTGESTPKPQNHSQDKQPSANPASSNPQADNSKPADFNREKPDQADQDQASKESGKQNEPKPGEQEGARRSDARAENASGERETQSPAQSRDAAKQLERFADAARRASEELKRPRQENAADNSQKQSDGKSGENNQQKSEPDSKGDRTATDSKPEGSQPSNAAASEERGETQQNPGETREGESRPSDTKASEQKVDNPSGDPASGDAGKQGQQQQGQRTEQTGKAESERTNSDPSSGAQQETQRNATGERRPGEAQSGENGPGKTPGVSDTAPGKLPDNLSETLRDLSKLPPGALREMAEQLRDMNREQKSAEDLQRQANEMRKQAEDWLKQASPEDREAMRNLARQLQDQSRQDQQSNENLGQPNGPQQSGKPDAEPRGNSTGDRSASDDRQMQGGQQRPGEAQSADDAGDNQRDDLPGSSGAGGMMPRGPRQAARETTGPIGEDVIDARGEPIDGSDPSPQTIAQSFGDGTARTSGGKQGSDAIRAAAAGAERAVEQQAVPREYSDLVRRVFRRYLERTNQSGGAAQ